MFLEGLIVLQFLKKLLRQDGKTELGGGHSLNETLNRWKLILRVYESVAIYKK